MWQAALTASMDSGGRVNCSARTRIT